MFAGLPYNAATNESKDGKGAADHDKTYECGHRPRSNAPWPFTERQYVRLLIRRSASEDLARRRYTARRPTTEEEAA